METPFIYSTYVTGRNFIGRKAECNTLGNLLGRGENVVIYAPPKSGKRSLIQQALFNMRVTGGQFTACEVNLFNIRNAETFLTMATIKIILLGLIAFIFSTAGGVIFGQVMKVMSGGKINPVIGAAGVSAVPMAARVCQKVVQKEFPGSYVLMHAMGPNVAGVIGTAVAAGAMLTLLSK